MMRYFRDAIERVIQSKNTFTCDYVLWREDERFLQIRHTEMTPGTPIVYDYTTINIRIVNDHVKLSVIYTESNKEEERVEDTFPLEEVDDSTILHFISHLQFLNDIHHKASLP